MPQLRSRHAFSGSFREGVLLLLHRRVHLALQAGGEVCEHLVLLGGDSCLATSTSSSELLSRLLQGRFDTGRHGHLKVILANHRLQVVLAPLDFPLGHVPVTLVILLSDEVIGVSWVVNALDIELVLSGARVETQVELAECASLTGTGNDGVLLASFEIDAHRNLVEHLRGRLLYWLRLPVLLKTVFTCRKLEQEEHR